MPIVHQAQQFAEIIQLDAPFDEDEDKALRLKLFLKAVKRWVRDMPEGVEIRGEIRVGLHGTTGTELWIVLLDPQAREIGRVPVGATEIGTDPANSFVAVRIAREASAVAKLRRL